MLMATLSLSSFRKLKRSTALSRFRGKRNCAKLSC